MDGIWSLMDVIFLVAGIYVLYAFIKMQTTGEINKTVLLGNGVDVKKCKDIEAYKSFIGPRMLIFGIGCVLYGGAGLIDAFVADVPDAVYTTLMIIFFIVIVWFIMALHNSVKKFW